MLSGFSSLSAITAESGGAQDVPAAARLRGWTESSSAGHDGCGGSSSPLASWRWSWGGDEGTVLPAFPHLPLPWLFSWLSPPPPVLSNSSSAPSICSSWLEGPASSARPCWAVGRSWLNPTRCSGQQSSRISTLPTAPVPGCPPCAVGLRGLEVMCLSARVPTDRVEVPPPHRCHHGAKRSVGFGCWRAVPGKHHGMCGCCGHPSPPHGQG